jgi:dTDP-glucose 4,6-dehydratase
MRETHALGVAEVSTPPPWIAVAGASGFIGTALVRRLLAAGQNVVALSRSIDDAWTARLVAHSGAGVNRRLRVRRGDLRDRTFLAEALRGVQTLFYLAAEQAHHLPPRSDLDLIAANIEATLTVSACAAERDVHSLVWVSSALVYGTKSAEPRSEDAALRPETAYAAAKAAGEIVACGAGRASGQTVTIVRPFNCYGPGQSGHSFLGRLISEAKAGDEIHLEHLNSVRDFVYVDDVVEGLVRAAERHSDDQLVINIGTGVATSLVEAVEMFRSLAARHYTIRTKELESMPRTDHLVADAQRAAATLGWFPHCDLASGLQKVLIDAGIGCRLGVT